MVDFSSTSTIFAPLRHFQCILKWNSGYKVILNGNDRAHLLYATLVVLDTKVFFCVSFQEILGTPWYVVYLGIHTTITSLKFNLINHTPSVWFKKEGT